MISVGDSSKGVAWAVRDKVRRNRCLGVVAVLAQIEMEARVALVTNTHDRADATSNTDEYITPHGFYQQSHNSEDVKRLVSTT